MGNMNADMMSAMGAENIDIAFVCGMIPHHQGAIDMAKVETRLRRRPVGQRAC